jgi:dolichol-phosphate mannosyltransferase
VRGLVAWLGFNQIGVPYERPARVAGRSKYAWRDRFRLATGGLASFSGWPLKMAVRLGLLLSFGSVLGLVWVVTTWAVGRTVPGWASLTFTAFFFGGLQLFFLGLVGAYVARVYDEVKGRPRYIVRDTWSSSGNPEDVANGP